MKKLFLRSIIISMALGLFSPALQADSQAVLSEREKQRLASAAGAREELLGKVPRGCFQEGGSQTEAFLKAVDWDTVECRLWISSDDLSDLKRMTHETIIPREKKHANDYFVFYHAQQRSFWVYYEFHKQLHEALYGTKLNDFLFLRDVNDFHQKRENVDEWYKRYGDKVTDGQLHQKKILLSTNLSFPGNLDSGESSFSYFAHSRSCGSPQVSCLFYRLLNGHIPFTIDMVQDKEFIAQCVHRLQKLSDRISENKKSKYGLLTSLFIPKELVDSCAKITHVGGIKMILDTFKKGVVLT